MSLMSIATNGLGAKVEAQRLKLATNSFRAPMRVLLGHAKNQFAQLCRDARPTRRTVPALEGPVTLPCPLMPAHDCVGLDDEQGMPPARPESRKQRPEEAVLFSKARPAFLSLVNRQLVSQREALQEEVSAFREHSAGD